MERKPLIKQLSDRLEAGELSDAILASRNDQRPAMAADLVFAELYALIDDIEAEQIGK